MGFKREIAENPNTPATILRKLVYERDKYNRYKATKNPSVTADILAELINSENPEYQPRRLYNFEYNSYKDWSEFWLEYPNVSSLDLYSVLLSKELADENTKFNNFIVSKYSDIPQFKIYLANKGEKKYRLSLARSSDTPVYILEKLAKDNDVDIRIALAKLHNRPLHILLKLSQDSDVRVRQNLYKYNQTPVEILEILKSDESEEIRKLIARSCKNISEVLIHLSKDSSNEVKQNVAKNSNTPVEILEKLLREDNIFSISNHNTPSHVVAEKIVSTKDSTTLHKILERSLKTYPQISSDVWKN